ncbi:MAG: tetratricopeptide repeat protein, partial [Actinomycetota bacterium]|nr:tetratricopeptide repeat protein [Actinomycetota bacterium]
GITKINNKFIKTFKEDVNKLLEEKRHDRIIDKCYEYLKLSINKEVINLLIVSLINVNQFNLASYFIDKLIELTNDPASVKNLKRLKAKLINIPKTGRNTINAKKNYDYLLNVIRQKEENEKATISLCMIVKNEEKNIKNCLESIKSAVSEIIIVDTGSADKTLEIAKKYNAKIIHHKWNDDFAQARNVSIKNATSDYIMFLDADEYVDKKSIGFFYNLKKPTYPHSYLVKLLNFTEREEDSNFFVEHYSTRIWTNNPSYEFKGRIHENLVFNDASCKPPQIKTDVAIFHKGYMKNEMDKKNKLERNLSLLKAAVQDDPDNGFNEYNLGIHYKVMRDFENSIKHFKLMQQKQEGKAISFFYIFGLSQMANSYYESGNFTEAVNTAKKALELNKDFKEALFSLALAQLSLKQYDKAIENFNKILSDKNSDIVIGGTMDLSIRSWKTYVSLGVCYINTKEFDKAVKSFKKAIRINKYSGDAVLNLITAYHMSNNSKEIIPLVEKIKKTKFSLKHAEKIIEKLFLLGFKKQAVSFLECQKSNYENGKFDNLELVFMKKENLMKADICYSQKKYKDADKYYSSYYKADNFDFAGMDRWGHANLLLGDFLKAENIYESILLKHPGSWSIYHNLATAKMSLEKLDEAIDYFKKAKSANPGSLETYLNLGKIYLFKKQYDSAVETLNYAVFIDGDYKLADLLYYLAEALFNTGNFEESIEIILKYLSINTANAEAYNLAGLCFFVKKDYINASLYFLKAIGLDNDKNDYYVYLGNSLKKLEMFDDAKTSYEYVLSLDEHNVAAQAGYASLLLQSTLKDLNRLCV